jgi:membrane fusion protein, multidrug efflux system
MMEIIFLCSAERRRRAAQFIRTPLWPAGFAVAFGIAALVLAGCSGHAGGERGNKGKNEAKEEAVPVEVVSISRGSIEAVLKISTHLEAEEDVKVFSRASNLVSEMLVEEGDLVERGDLLARLEDHTQTIQLAKAQSQLERARQEYQRQERLHGDNLISEQAFAEARFELRQLELSHEEAKRQLDYTEIRAPISGTVTRRLVRLGDHITNNQHLFDIIDFNSMVALVYLPEMELARVSLGQPVRFSSPALGDEIFNGHVKRISPVVERKTGTVKITVGVRDVGRLRPGMYVLVELVLATRSDALLITKRAWVWDRDQIYVFRLLPDRRVERVLVEPQLMNKDYFEPSEGFQEGDQIVIAGHTGLKDGALVRLPGDPRSGENQNPASVSVP